MVFTLFRGLFCVFWSVLLIPLSILLMVVTFNRKIPVIMARTMWAPGILWACGISLEVYGADKIDLRQSHIFVANHMSYLDIPVLFRALPANLHFIAKKEIRWVPFIGLYMMATGMLFIDRKNRLKALDSLKKAGQLIKNGKNVLMFPEGTRSRNNEIASFKQGPFLLASQAGVSLVPVVISGTDTVLKRGAFGVTPGTVQVNVGEAVDPGDFGHVRELMEALRGRMLGLRDQIKKAV